MMPTRLKDVARSAGVSIATVSRVLADKPHISAAVRSRVLQAVAELDYHPSRVARSLQALQARVIGLLLPDVRDHFFAALVRAVEDVAYVNRYTFLLCSTDEEVTKSATYVELMQAEHVAGVLVVPTPGAEAAYRQLMEAAIPVVAVERRIPQAAVDTVLLDHAGPVQRQVTQLIEAGHERIAAILTYDEGSGSHTRGCGYRQALCHRGLPVRPELICSGPATPAFGRQAVEELLALQPSPTALYVATHLQTLAVMQVLAEREMSIPDDLAVVGSSECAEPLMRRLAFAAAKPPAYLAGETATNLLLARIAGSTQPPQMMIVPVDPA